MRTDDEHAYLEPGDHIELYDSRGLNVGLAQIVEDPDDVTFWPTQEIDVYAYCIAGGNGRSLIGTFDVPMRTRRGMYLTIDPVFGLGKRRA